MGLCSLLWWECEFMLRGPVEHTVPSACPCNPPPTVFGKGVVKVSLASIPATTREQLVTCSPPGHQHVFSGRYCGMVWRVAC